jgi:hypothetical protein
MYETDTAGVKCLNLSARVRGYASHSAESVSFAVPWRWPTLTESGR